MSRLDDARRALSPFRYMRLPGGDRLHDALKLIEDGRAADAEHVLRALAIQRPEMAAAHLFLALALNEAGKRAPAVRALGAAHVETLDGTDELCLIGEALLDWDQPDMAAAAFRRAVALSPGAAQAYQGLGRADSLMGDATAAIRNLQKAALLQPSLARIHADLGHEYRATNMNDAAVASYRRALEIAPDDEAVHLALDAVIASMVPPWHFAMVNDTRRNRAFDRAIRKAVGEGSQVLDIGTGTGLLAMMAARAGARSVTACETVAPLAEVAEEVIAANGLAGRIAVVRKRSTAMVVGEDMARRADVLVAEIVDAGLLSEGVIEAFEHARRHLLTRDARIIPKGAQVFAVPVESREIAAGRRVTRAAGFDMRPFNRLAPRLYLQTDLRHLKWRALARPIAVFDFDFAGGALPEPRRRIAFRPTGTGTCHAIAFWFRLDLDDEIAIATGPSDPPTHWQQAVYALDRPRRLRQGVEAALLARHNRNTIFLELARR